MFQIIKPGGKFLIEGTRGIATLSCTSLNNYKISGTAHDGETILFEGKSEDVINMVNELVGTLLYQSKDHVFTFEVVGYRKTFAVEVVQAEAKESTCFAPGFPERFKLTSPPGIIDESATRLQSFSVDKDDLHLDVPDEVFLSLDINNQQLFCSIMAGQHDSVVQADDKVQFFNKQKLCGWIDIAADEYRIAPEYLRDVEVTVSVPLEGFEIQMINDALDGCVHSINQIQSSQELQKIFWESQIKGLKSIGPNDYKVFRTKTIKPRVH